MSPMGYAALSFVLVLGITFVSGYLVLQLWPGIRRERFAARAAQGPSSSILRFQDRPVSGWKRTMERIGRTVQPRDLTRASKIRLRLAWAGYHDPRALTLFWGAKLALAVIGVISYPFLGVLTQRVLPNTTTISLVAFAVGFFLPDFWLHNRVKARHRLIVNMLPDVLDPDPF